MKGFLLNTYKNDGTVISLCKLCKFINKKRLQKGVILTYPSANQASSTRSYRWHRTSAHFRLDSTCDSVADIASLMKGLPKISLFSSKYLAFLYLHFILPFDKSLQFDDDDDGFVGKMLVLFVFKLGYSLILHKIKRSKRIPPYLESVSYITNALRSLHFEVSDICLFRFAN